MQGDIPTEEATAIISKDLMQWSNRKDHLFNPDRAIRLALRHIEEGRSARQAQA